MVDAGEQTVKGTFFGLRKKGAEGAGRVGGDSLDGFQLEAVLKKQVSEDGGKKQGKEKEKL